MNTSSSAASGEDHYESLCLLIRDTVADPVLQRLQCVLLWKRFGLPARDIAAIVGWSHGTVRNFKSEFTHLGAAAFAVRPRGGARRAALSMERERQLLKSFTNRARSTGYLDVKGLKGAYERLVGRVCALSTIYRIIHRHGLGSRLPRARRTVIDERKLRAKR